MGLRPTNRDEDATSGGGLPTNGRCVFNGAASRKLTLTPGLLHNPPAVYNLGEEKL